MGDELFVFSIIAVMDASEGCLLSILLDARNEDGRGGDTGDELDDESGDRFKSDVVLCTRLGDGSDKSRANCE